MAILRNERLRCFHWCWGPLRERETSVRAARSKRSSRNYDVGGVVTACEYLAHRRLIGKAATSVRLTKRSTADVQELAFFHTGAHG